jgi:hypothetical protein
MSLPVVDVDSADRRHRNCLAVVSSRSGDGMYKLVSKEGSLMQLCSRSQFVRVHLKNERAVQKTVHRSRVYAGKRTQCVL